MGGKENHDLKREGAKSVFHCVLAAVLGNARVENGVDLNIKGQRKK